jgi:23S rRNA pseudouridine2605 synthase
MKRPDNSSRKNSRGGAGKSERTGNRKRTGSDEKGSGGFRGRKDDRPSFDKPKRDDFSGSAAPRGRRSNFNNFDSPRNIERGDSKPKSSGWDDFDAPSERGAGRSFSRDRKPFGESSDRPKRSYNREEKSDRPFSRDRKPFGDDERPKRSYNREEKSDRPYSRDRKPFGDDEKPQRSYNREEKSDRPYSRDRKPFGDDEKPKRSYNREEKSDRPYSRDRKPFGDDEKPKRSYNREEKSDRPYSRDRKPFGGDETEKPKRSYKREEGDDRPARKTEGRIDKSDRSKRAYKGAKEEFKSKKSQRGTFTENGPIRLNRYISMAGICSRREADEMILAGVVSVNGEVVTELGTKVAAGDDIRYNGERLRNEELKYVLLNKPKDYITTMEDPTARKTVMELISGACRERVYPVGRLDRNTTGLLLFTNDGELAKVLTHPSSMVRKIYHVELDKNVKAGDLKQILEGIELEDGTMRADEVTYDGDGSDKKSIGIQIHSGKNRIVRRIFEHLGYQVMKLDRVMFAGLTKRDLPRGRWRVLNENEIGMLKMISSKPMKGQR